MKVKHFKDKYEKKVKKIDKFPRRFTNVNWVIKITLIAFLISLMFSVITEVFVVRLNIVFGILITFLIIFIGVIFDMIGVSVTAADLKPFNSMASKKVSGSKTAI